MNVIRPWTVFVLAVVLFLAFLGGHDVWAPDEPYFAEGAREMVADGQWAVPHVNGVVTTDKPPLFFWLIAVLSLPLGTVTALTARLPSALAGLGILVIVFELSRAFNGKRSASYAVFFLSTAYLFWEKARWAQTDATLCFFIWLALASFFFWRSGRLEGRRAGIVFWAAAAAAVLTKGPVGLLIPVGIVVVCLAVDRELGRFRDFSPILGPTVFVAIISAWIVVATVGGHGEYSVWGALKEHFVDRGIHGMHHRQPFWYYGKRLPVLLFPWTGLAVGAMVAGWKRREHALDRFALVCVVFVVLFFSVSTEKRELYVLPAMPAFSLLLARFAGAMDGPNRILNKKWVTLPQGLIGALLFGVGLAVVVAGSAYPVVPLFVQRMLASILVLGGLATAVAALKGRVKGSVVLPGLTMAGAYLLAAGLVYPAVDQMKSSREFSVRMKDATAQSRSQGHPVLACRLSNLPEAFAFHTHGLYTTTTDSIEDLERHLRGEERVFAAVDRRVLDGLEASVRRDLVVVDQARLSRIDVVLVSNAGD